MDMSLAERTRTFIEISEIWVPEGDRLVQAGGNYGGYGDFADASGHESFAKGEGLPGKAWAEARPVVLKEFDGSYFKRTEAAKEAGLTSAVAVPVFANETLKAVLVLLCSDDDVRTGAIEVWSEKDGLLMLEDGYYGAARHFEWVSQHTHFPRGQGLPGGVWAANTPMLMRDLGSGYKFIRADSAGRAGLTTGLGLPIPVPGGQTCRHPREDAFVAPPLPAVIERFVWAIGSRGIAPPQAIVIDGNNAAVVFAANDIGSKALAIGDVVDINLLVFTQAGNIQQLAVNGTGAFIVQHRVGYGCFVKLGFQHGGLHTLFLSISLPVW